MQKLLRATPIIVSLLGTYFLSVSGIWDTSDLLVFLEKQNQIISHGMLNFAWKDYRAPFIVSFIEGLLLGGLVILGIYRPLKKLLKGKVARLNFLISFLVGYGIAIALLALILWGTALFLHFVASGDHEQNVKNIGFFLLVISGVMGLILILTHKASK